MTPESSPARPPEFQRPTACCPKLPRRTAARRACPPWRVALAAFLLAAGLAGCSHEETKVENQMTSYSAQGAQAALFTVPADQMGHIQMFTVKPTKMERTLRLPGAVNYNLFKTTPVITAVGGPVSRILVVPGEFVRRGQPLLYVRSPDFTQLRASFLKARNVFNLTDKNFARAQDLYSHHAIAERDLLQAESDRTQAQADLQAAEQSLRILGLTDAQIQSGTMSPEIPVLAPIDGQVVERLAAPGQLLQAGATQCFTISDMSTVWVLVNVYQRDLPYVRVGEPVAIGTDAYPQVFRGRISYLSPALDPNTRTLTARIVTDNPGLRLKNNMYVTAVVDAGSIPGALALPEAAVLRDSENHPFVYVAVANNQFGRRLVDIGQQAPGLIQITSGLEPGDRVVASGSLFLQFANSLQH
ncbi:MAG TPA: efflux RND transporter periplasmic adaptor subunit [Candidatus Acidoferrales bacterium]|nr:efflux RND transporter periplasmic adaptor subunit [Candidatus Acidoferrales bacterium]